ncbi:MAG: hypothetical protein ACI8QG_002708, partial [Flavobacteriales bacterium]
FNAMLKKIVLKLNIVGIGSNKNIIPWQCRHNTQRFLLHE